MPNSLASSDGEVCALVGLFLGRSGCDEKASPEQVLTGFGEGLYREGACESAQSSLLQLFLNKRHVNGIEVVRELHCDGLIEPIGKAFGDGFRMLLKRGAPASRMRFTMAHEVCHTFFYELVPEMKFAAHSPDQEEERLCNFGAAVLLIPAGLLCRRAARLPVCFESLQYLAQIFCVSLSTMLLRLKALDIWDCGLSFWLRKWNGDFILGRVYVVPHPAWQWEDESILTLAWESDVPSTVPQF